MRSGLVADCIAGAVSGTAATYVMGLANDAIHERQPEALRLRERELESHTAPQTLALRLLRAFGDADPPEEVITLGGKIVHWGFGVSMGSIYACSRRSFPWIENLAGFPYAMALYGIHYFGPPALGLSPASNRFPVGTRMRGFAYHVVYGAALSTGTRVLRPQPKRA